MEAGERIRGGLVVFRPAENLCQRTLRWLARRWRDPWCAVTSPALAPWAMTGWELVPASNKCWYLASTVGAAIGSVGGSPALDLARPRQLQL